MEYFNAEVSFVKPATLILKEHRRSADESAALLICQAVAVWLAKELRK